MPRGLFLDVRHCPWPVGSLQIACDVDPLGAGFVACSSLFQSACFAGSGWLVWASLLVVAGLCVHIKLIQLWVCSGTWLGEGFPACCDFVWLGEGLSPKYRLYTSCSFLVPLQLCFGCPILGLLWRLLPLCSIYWWYGFHLFGWGSLPNCLGY
jgi:hypothetical protein